MKTQKVASTYANKSKISYVPERNPKPCNNSELIAAKKDAIITSLLDLLISNSQIIKRKFNHENSHSPSGKL